MIRFTPSSNGIPEQEQTTLIRRITGSVDNIHDNFLIPRVQLRERQRSDENIDFANENNQEGSESSFDSDLDDDSSTEDSLMEHKTEDRLMEHKSNSDTDEDSDDDFRTSVNENNRESLNFDVISSSENSLTFSSDEDENDSNGE